MGKTKTGGTTGTNQYAVKGLATTKVSSLSMVSSSVDLLDQVRPRLEPDWDILGSAQRSARTRRLIDTLQQENVMVRIEGDASYEIGERTVPLHQARDGMQPFRCRYDNDGATASAYCFHAGPVEVNLQCHLPTIAYDDPQSWAATLPVDNKGRKLISGWIDEKAVE